MFPEEKISDEDEEKEVKRITYLCALIENESWWVKYCFLSWVLYLKFWKYLFQNEIILFRNRTRRKKRSLKKEFLTKTEEKEDKRNHLFMWIKYCFLSWVLYLKFLKCLFKNEIICESSCWFRMELFWRWILEAHLGLNKVDINTWSRSKLNNYEEKKNDYEKEKTKFLLN